MPASRFTFSYDAGSALTALAGAMIKTLDLPTLHRVLKTLAEQDKPGADAAYEAVTLHDDLACTDDEWCAAARSTTP